MILSAEHVLIRDMARQFAREQLAPNAARWDRECGFPGEAIIEMGRLGLWGMMVPEAWGGSSADNVSYALAMEEIAAGDAATSTVMAVQNLACACVQKGGDDAQKERFLKPMAGGGMLACFGLSEPHAGSDAAAIRTRARRDGDSYVINGSKQFITSGKNAAVGVIFASTDPAAGGRGISAFIVPTDTPGFTVARVERKLGQHASDTCHLVFDDMRVPAENRLGEEGDGYRLALANLEGGRIAIAAQAVGIAQAAYEHALRYAQERVTFGEPIFEHQAVAFRLADMATRIEAARQLVLHAAVLRDGGLPCLKEAAMAKLFASEVVEKVCSDAVQTHGGYGYLADFPVERLYRDQRVCQIYEGTSDIQKMLISRFLVQDLT